MSADEQISTPTTSSSSLATDALVEQARSEKILQAKDLYSQGSRNYLVKSYAEAADELSRVCELYGELYGELSDEVAMPYLLYAKSLIAINEYKVIDVPDEADDDDDDDDDEEEAGDDSDAEGAPGDDADAAEKNGEASAANGEAAVASSTAKIAVATAKVAKLDTIAENADVKKATTAEDDAEADSTENGSAEKTDKKPTTTTDKPTEEAQVSSTDGDDAQPKTKKSVAENGAAVTTMPVEDGEKPSTSNGSAKVDGKEQATEEEDNEAASGLQLAWEILELAARIFSRQGHSGLPNLAEVQTELGNIEFENGILEAAREDYEKALLIYQELQMTSNYRRAMAEMHYKIGLTYLMEQLNKEGAAALKEACALLEDEITEIKAKPELGEKDKNNVQDMEETMQEIQLKIIEIEESGSQLVAEVRAALDDYKNPLLNANGDGAGPSTSAAVSGGGVGSSSSTAVAASSSASASSSSSSSAITSSSKPTDITHLIKRKKPEEPTSEAEAAASPAKRAAH